MRCNNPEALHNFVLATYSGVHVRKATQEQTMYTFECGLVMNVYTTKTVMFQGNSADSSTMLGIVNVINTINAAS